MTQIQTFDKASKPVSKKSESHSGSGSWSRRGAREYRRGGGGSGNGSGPRTKLKGPTGGAKKKRGGSSARSSTSTAGFEASVYRNGNRISRGGGGIGMMPT